jgi:hypothetical protein
LFSTLLLAHNVCVTITWRHGGGTCANIHAYMGACASVVTPRSLQGEMPRALDVLARFVDDESRARHQRPWPEVKLKLNLKLFQDRDAGHLSA